MIPPRKLWVGSMNDGLAIIDRPPSPAPYDGPIPGGAPVNVIAVMVNADVEASEIARLMAAGPELADLLREICRHHLYSLPSNIRTVIRRVTDSHGIRLPEYEAPQKKTPGQHRKGTIDTRTVSEGGPPPTLADLGKDGYLQGIMARTKS